MTEPLVAPASTGPDLPGQRSGERPGTPDQSALPVTDPRWGAALDEVLREPRRLALHLQAIVEMTTGDVAGYEALSRFDGAIDASPDHWFAAAEHWGVNARLQARVLSTAIALRDELPPNTFLTVNVDPHLLLDSAVTEQLLDHSDLSRLVVEITDHSRATDPAALAALLKRVRRRGALIAVDDAGSGYAGLSRILALRPHIVKIDRGLIVGVDTDPIKRSLVEVIADLVDRKGGWVLAEGLETLGEVAAIVGLGVALGQGYILGRPEPVAVASIPAEIVARIKVADERARSSSQIVSLVQPAEVGTDPTTCEVLVDANGKPQLVRWGSDNPAEARHWSTPMIVSPTASLAEVALRACSRDAADIAAPLVCTDSNGLVRGIVTLEDLVIALSMRH